MDAPPDPEPDTPISARDLGVLTILLLGFLAIMVALTLFI